MPKIYTYKDVKELVNKKTNGEVEILPNQEFKGITGFLWFRHVNNCKLHGGYVWKTRTRTLLKTSSVGCRYCSNIAIHNNQRNNIDKMLEDINEKWKGEFEVVKESLNHYKNHRSEIELIHHSTMCNNHHCFSTFNNLMKGPVCDKCHSIKVGDANRGSLKEFSDWILEFCGKEYEVLPNQEYINATTKIKMKHNKKSCKHPIFYVTPNGFKNGGSRCPSCNCAYHMELWTLEWLKIHSFENISIYQARHKGLKRKLPLSYDFEFPENKVILECQGQQHYFPVKMIGTKRGDELKLFKDQQLRDKIKYEWAISSGYTMLYMKYTCNSKRKTFNWLDNNLLPIINKKDLH